MTPKTDFDIIVLGGGIIGAAAAQVLARQGKKLLLIDQFEPGHPHGSSHGDGRIIRLAYPEPLYLEMALQIYDEWARLEQEWGQPLQTTSGGLDIGPLDDPNLLEIIANFEQAGVPYQRLSAAEVRRRFPMFHLDDSSEGLYQQETGVLFATAAVRALWQLTQRAGGQTLSGEKITQIAVQRQAVRLTAESGQSWTAGRLVLTPGGWAGPLLQTLNLTLPLTVTQEQVGFFKSKPDRPHTPRQMPVLIDHHYGAPQLFALPQIEIPGVKIGLHHGGQLLDRPEQHRPLSQSLLDMLTRRVAERFSSLEPEPFQNDTCLYTTTPDRHFIIDRHPDFAHIVIGAGFSGHGFKFAPLIGQMLAALAFDEVPPVPLEMFALQRFADPAQLETRTGV